MSSKSKLGALKNIKKSQEKSEKIRDGRNFSVFLDAGAYLKLTSFVFYFKPMSPLPVAWFGINEVFGLINECYFDLVVEKL